MRKFITIILLAFASISIWAQGAGEIYNKYSGRSGVNAIFVSPMVYQLVKVLPPIPIQGQEVDLSKLIQDFKGMHFINLNGAELISEFRADARKYTRKNRLDLMMESKDAKGTTWIYATQSEGTITTLLIMTLSGTHMIFAAINGKITPEALAQLIRD